ncbi:MAG: hypothetical protein H0T76_12010 [Nannocystis sp.]|nr:hypothetical protein [Nannocystis sp.]MBA3547202.1 hypothetical protein [Nannocystis sp.]
MTTRPRSLGTTALALRLHALRGTTTYFAYLAPRAAIARTLAELRDDLDAYADDEGPITIADASSAGAAVLLDETCPAAADFFLLDVGAYQEADWRILDRRRSEFARTGVTVLVMTPDSFDAIMRVAPNLASWLGGNVLCHDDPALAPGQRERSLAGLREWSGKTDKEVLREAQEGRLPRDPEYAEWLMLLGRGDLLDG